MLVISRKPNQSFQIGPDVWVHVVSVKGCQVRLGIEAPKDVAIVRHELDEYVEPPSRAEHVAP